MSVMGAHTWVLCCAAQEEEMTDSERRFKAERAGGNYSQGTKEMQEKKYIERKEQDRKRRELFNDALAMYKKGDLENVRRKTRGTMNGG